MIPFGAMKGTVLPDSSIGKESTCNVGDPSSIPGLGSSPGEGIGYLLGFSGGSHSKDSAGNTGDLGSIPGSPGEENGVHSSILAWRIPWTEEPSGLQSMGLQRVRHN